MTSKQIGSVYERIRQILESARTTVVRSVNTTQVLANWLVGREIVEEEQRGKRRAEYGERLIRTLSAQITAEFGRGYSVNNLERFRDFYVTYPELMAGPIPHAPRGELTDQPLGEGRIARNARGQRAAFAEVTDPEGDWPTGEQIPHAARGESTTSAPLTRSVCHAARDESFRARFQSEIRYALRSESWRPGLLHPNLSWTHYRTLLRVDKAEARAFYEIEAIENCWSARELERQINSLLYERLALSKDKKGLMRLATKGQEIQQPIDIFKDPVVIEFLGLPEFVGLGKAVDRDAALAAIRNE